MTTAEKIREVVTHHVDAHRCKHQGESDPEAPITMRSFPVWAMLRVWCAASCPCVYVVLVLDFIHPIRSLRNFVDSPRFGFAVWFGRRAGGATRFVGCTQYLVLDTLVRTEVSRIVIPFFFRKMLMVRNDVYPSCVTEVTSALLYGTPVL